jgi:hypothetical protein
MYACTVAAVVLNSMRTALKSDIWPVRESGTRLPYFGVSFIRAKIPFGHHLKLAAMFVFFAAIAFACIFPADVAQMGVRGRWHLRRRISLPMVARGAALPDWLACAGSKLAVDPAPQLTRSVSSHVFGNAPTRAVPCLPITHCLTPDR